jgi:hypothetical protein
MGRFQAKPSSLERSKQSFNPPPFSVICDRRFGLLVCEPQILQYLIMISY